MAPADDTVVTSTRRWSVNTRERFLASMAFETVERVPLWEWDYWGETLRIWRNQGAPLRPDTDGGINPQTTVEEQGAWDPLSSVLLTDLPLEPDAETAFRLDPGLHRVPLNAFIYPLFEYRVLEEHGDVIIAQDERGHIRRDKKGHSSISNILEHLVNDREDWERVKAERLQLSLAGRLPADWPEQREKLRDRDFVLAIGGHSALAGFYHPTRYLMGPEHLLYSFYDQPDLVRDVMNHLADLQVYLFDQVLSQVDVDLGFACEDLGYKAGPFISPAMFREFMLPCYKKVTGVLRDHGVEIMIVDSDGDNWKLIPLFMEGGVTGMAPMEVAAGMDVVALREAFPRLQMWGGIDKRKIAAGKAAIDEELASKVPGVLKTGGYIPCCDHGVPPDVSWDDFRYYRERLTELVEGPANPH
jgi:uroporphyrinogen decarboxylase